MQNLLTITIPPADLQQALTHFQQGAAILAPYLHALTPEERQRMLKMADKTVAFVTKTRDYAHNNPSFVPAFVDLQEFEQDVNVMSDLTPLHQLLESLALDTDSTMMLAGSDAYATALTLYNNIKYLAKNNQPGAQAAYDDLSQRFPGSANAGRKTKPLKAS
ncbi:MAG: hypothetical protein EOO57_05615 [Hymenobacter sp.]|nr:MAG: hypothetical protein EOO57_05615 [Hymenobacter sp.]